LIGLYPIDTTGAPRGSAGYDGWGTQSSRTYNGVTATLSYDALNRLVNWQSASGASERTVYDADGERVLTRATNLGTTTLTVSAFGLQELFYTGTGTLSSQTGYYTLSGHLIGSTNGTTTTYYLTDAQGSLLISLSASALTGEQLYAPSGPTRYTVGTPGTAKAFTGQEADLLTGLYYYHARWYDPVVGLFVSVDTQEGNAQGVNPYGYVRENPETATDPTGERAVGCQPGTEGCSPTGTPGSKHGDPTIKTLMLKVGALITNTYQLVGAQGGLISDIASDWSNVQSDWSAMSQE
jgi:RHS repeat-associated protein